MRSQDKPLDVLTSVEFATLQSKLTYEFIKQRLFNYFNINDLETLKKKLNTHKKLDEKNIKRICLNFDLYNKIFTKEELLNFKKNILHPTKKKNANEIKIESLKKKFDHIITTRPKKIHKDLTKDEIKAIEVNSTTEELEHRLLKFLEMPRLSDLIYALDDYVSLKRGKKNKNFFTKICSFFNLYEYLFEYDEVLELKIKYLENTHKKLQNLFNSDSSIIIDKRKAQDQINDIKELLRHDSNKIDEEKISTLKNKINRNPVKKKNLNTNEWKDYYTWKMRLFNQTYRLLSYNQIKAREQQNEINKSRINYEQLQTNNLKKRIQERKNKSNHQEEELSTGELKTIIEVNDYEFNSITSRNNIKDSTINVIYFPFIFAEVRFYKDEIIVRNLKYKIENETCNFYFKSNEIEEVVKIDITLQKTTLQKQLSNIKEEYLNIILDTFLIFNFMVIYEQDDKRVIKNESSKLNTIEQPTKSKDKLTKSIHNIVKINNYGNKINYIRVGSRGYIDGVWLVCGHRRKQRYKDGIKTIWISPYKKGEGKRVISKTYNLKT